VKPSLEEAEGAAVLFELWTSAALCKDLQPGINVALRLRAQAGIPGVSGHMAKMQQRCTTCAGAGAAVYFRGAAAALCRVNSLEALLNYPLKAQPPGSLSVTALFTGPLGTVAVGPAKDALLALLEHFGDSNSPANGRAATGGTHAAMQGEVAAVP